MPTYPHPGPLEIRLDLVAGDARVTASARDDVVVEIVPRDPGSDADVRATGAADVALQGDRLDVRLGGRRGRHRGAVDVSIAVPEGSRLRGRTGAGDITTEGALADCSVRCGAGAVRLGRVGALSVASGRGDVTVEEATGDVRVSTGAGRLELGPVAGAAVLTTGSGPIAVGPVGSVVAKTASGGIRVGRLTSGDADLRTAAGGIEIGIADGSAAHLDVRAHSGTVLQQLEPLAAPPREGPRVSVRARTGTGDVVVRRA
jgi:DUF4097 and DUF4098 domain-containing protein YvlB